MKRVGTVKNVKGGSIASSTENANEKAAGGHHRPDSTGTGEIREPEDLKQGLLNCMTRDVFSTMPGVPASFVPTPGPSAKADGKVAALSDTRGYDGDPFSASRSSLPNSFAMSVGSLGMIDVVPNQANNSFGQMFQEASANDRPFFSLGASGLSQLDRLMELSPSGTSDRRLSTQAQAPQELRPQRLDSLVPGESIDLELGFFATSRQQQLNDEMAKGSSNLGSNTGAAAQGAGESNAFTSAQYQATMARSRSDEAKDT
jgi:hypothetical protein